MLRIETEVEAPAWNDAGLAWDQLAAGAVHAAVQATPYAALDKVPDTVTEVSLRFVDDETIQELNRDYRGKDKATNVLSFPMMDPDELDGPFIPGIEQLLGDIVIAYETTQAEAQEQDKLLAAHVTHLIVHGTLHLLGYDHEDDTDAEAMEALERSILATLGLPDPYANGPIGHD